MQLFSKITETITDTSKVVAQKAKDISELTRLSTQISNEENRMNAAFLAIGRRFFEENAGEVSEEYITDFSAINDARAKIRSYKDQISIIKGVCVCQNCGMEIPSEASFCSNCGTKLEKPVPPKKEEEEKKEEEQTETMDAEEVNEDIKSEECNCTEEVNDAEETKTEI